MIGGSTTGARRGEEGFDDEGVTWRELVRLGELLLLFLFSNRELFLNPGSADNERPGGSAIGCGVVEGAFKIAAGAETECVIPGIPGVGDTGGVGGGTISLRRDPIRSHA